MPHDIEKLAISATGTTLGVEERAGLAPAVPLVEAYSLLFYRHSNRTTQSQQPWKLGCFIVAFIGKWGVSPISQWIVPRIFVGIPPVMLRQPRPKKGMHSWSYQTGGDWIIKHEGLNMYCNWIEPSKMEDWTLAFPVSSWKKTPNIRMASRCSWSLGRISQWSVVTKHGSYWCGVYRPWVHHDFQRWEKITTNKTPCLAVGLIVDLYHWIQSNQNQSKTYTSNDLMFKLLSINKFIIGLVTGKSIGICRIFFVKTPGLVSGVQMFPSTNPLSLGENRQLSGSKKREIPQIGHVMSWPFDRHQLSTLDSSKKVYPMKVDKRQYQLLWLW